MTNYTLSLKPSSCTKRNVLLSTNTKTFKTANVRCRTCHIHFTSSPHSIWFCYSRKQNVLENACNSIMKKITRILLQDDFKTFQFFNNPSLMFITVHYKHCSPVFMQPIKPGTEGRKMRSWREKRMSIFSKPLIGGNVFRLADKLPFSFHLITWQNRFGSTAEWGVEKSTFVKLKDFLK